MKQFDKKVSPFSKFHYGESESQEDRERTRRRIQKYVDNRWYDSWLSAARRVLTERMPREKFEAYARIVKVLTNIYATELTKNSIQFSTNRNGEHSWYVRVNTDADNIGNQRGDDGALVKITDHLTNRLQTESRDGTPILETYVVNDDYDTVSIFDTCINENCDRQFADDGRIGIEDVSIAELEKPNWDYKKVFEKQEANKIKKSRKKREKERMKRQEEEKKWKKYKGVKIYDKIEEQHDSPPVLNENSTWEKIKKVSRILYGKHEVICTDKIKREYKNRLYSMASSMEDSSYSNNFEYNHLEVTGGDLDIGSEKFITESLEQVGGFLTINRAETIISHSLKFVRRSIFAKKASTVILPNIKSVKSIMLKEWNFSEFWNDNGEFMWEEAEKQKRLIIPRKMRDKVLW